MLSDPDLVRNLGKLLQTYRDAPADQREEALLGVMREIKEGSGSTTSSESGSKKPTIAPAQQPLPTLASSVPPFEANLFSPNRGQDRRQHLRIKCFVAVELRVDDTDVPIWGNLSNTSVGGCLVETGHLIPNGAKVEIGLWVASGTIWVKGFALNGVVTHSGPTSGVRLRFAGMEPKERESLRQFLKYVQDVTRASQNESNYLQMLK
jgi:PilZ domain